MKEFIKVGIIQASLDCDIAYKDGPQIEALEGERVWNEIKKAFSAFKNEDHRPDFVLIPELTVPNKYIKKLERISKSLNSITIAGVDYQIDSDTNSIKNEAVIIVPNNWSNSSSSRRAVSFYIGKTYFAPTEEKKLEELNFIPINIPNLYLFETKNHGKFGVAICYDFLDIQRLMLYQTEVQHYFILAYNRDINTFSNIAETVARTVFCNVVVCNTGKYGSSLAISPYYRPHERIIYKTEGNHIFTSQIVNLPLKSLIEHQKGNADLPTDQRLFKSLPPGYKSRIELIKEKKQI